MTHYSEYVEKITSLKLVEFPMPFINDNHYCDITNKILRSTCHRPCAMCSFVTFVIYHAFGAVLKWNSSTRALYDWICWVIYKRNIEAYLYVNVKNIKFIFFFYASCSFRTWTLIALHKLISLVAQSSIWLFTICLCLRPANHSPKNVW